jgi:hypothetical protein
MAQHTTGSLVWVRDAKSNWSKAEVTAVGPGSLTVVTERGEQLTALKPEQALLQNLDSEDVPVSPDLRCQVGRGMHLRSIALGRRRRMRPAMLVRPHSRNPIAARRAGRPPARRVVRMHWQPALPALRPWRQRGPAPLRQPVQSVSRVPRSPAWPASTLPASTSHPNPPPRGVSVAQQLGRQQLQHSLLRRGPGPGPDRDGPGPQPASNLPTTPMQPDALRIPSPATRTARHHPPPPIAHPSPPYPPPTPTPLSPI